MSRAPVRANPAACAELLIYHGLVIFWAYYNAFGAFTVNRAQPTAKEVAPFAIDAPCLVYYRDSCHFRFNWLFALYKFLIGFFKSSLIGNYSISSEAIFSYNCIDLILIFLLEDLLIQHESETSSGLFE